MTDTYVVSALKEKRIQVASHTVMIATKKGARGHAFQAHPLP